jgi:hypothetical protein
VHVMCLEFVVYAPSAWDWKSHKIANPSWDEIEHAIRRLDCHEHPWLFLWATQDETKQNHNDGELLEIMGGKGSYWIAGTFDGYFQRRLDCPDKGEQEVAVWTSDQGFADAERHICRDVELVLNAAKFYYNHGGFDPSLTWDMSV